MRAFGYPSNHGLSGWPSLQRTQLAKAYQDLLSVISGTPLSVKPGVISPIQIGALGGIVPKLLELTLKVDKDGRTNRQFIVELDPQSRKFTALKYQDEFDGLQDLPLLPWIPKIVAALKQVQSAQPSG